MKAKLIKKPKTNVSSLKERLIRKLQAMRARINRFEKGLAVCKPVYGPEIINELLKWAREQNDGL